MNSITFFSPSRNKTVKKKRIQKFLENRMMPIFYFSLESEDKADELVQMISIQSNSR